MSHLESFAARLEQDPRLRSRVHAVEGETKQDVVRQISHVAHAFGIQLSADELESAFERTAAARERTAAERELTAAELEKVSGGGRAVNPALASAVRAKLGQQARSLLGEA